MTEKELAIKFKKYMEKLGYEVIEEVPFMSRCIDAVLVKNGKYRSIEHKLKNWKKALEQARTHQIGADKSYICMPVPANGFTSEFILGLKRRNIGLIAFNKGKFNLEIRARRNENWKPAKNSFINIIEKIKMANAFTD